LALLINAGRKPAKYKVGDYVYHYQPKTDPDGAPTKMLMPWVGPWRVEQVVRAKDVKMRHIDTGVEEEVHTSPSTRLRKRKSQGITTIGTAWFVILKTSQTDCRGDISCKSKIL
jgi:hypothetical protein